MGPQGKEEDGHTVFNAIFYLHTIVSRAFACHDGMSTSINSFLNIKYLGCRRF